MSSKRATARYVPGRNEPPRYAPRLASTVLLDPDEAAECTIYPPDIDKHKLVTHWVTAKEGSFLNVEDAR